MKDDEADLVENARQQPVQNGQPAPLRLVESQSIHYTALPPAVPGEALADEWNTYCQEVGRLLAEGGEGRYVLIKGKEIVGVHESWKQAREAGLKRYLSEPFFVHAIRLCEPYLRIRGLNHSWPS
jgi:hypothetical protein